MEKKIAFLLTAMFGLTVLSTEIVKADAIIEPDKEGTVCVIGELCYVGEEEHDNERIPVFELVKAEPFY